MPEQNIEINLRTLNKALKYFPTELKYNLGDAFDHIGRSFMKDFRKIKLRGMMGNETSPHGIFRTVKRATIIPKGDLTGMGVEIFSDSKIAERQEEGGIVKGAGGNLAVPLSMNKTMFSGSGRLRKRFKNPASLKKVFPVEIMGKKYLAQSERRNKGIKLLYILKEKIRMWPQLRFYKTWDENLNRRLEILDKAVEKAVS